MTKKEIKKLDKQLDAAFKTQGHGIQFNVMKLGPLFNDARNAVIAGTTVEAAMQASIEKNRIQ